MITIISGLLTAFVITPLPPPTLPVYIPVHQSVRIPTEVNVLQDFINGLQAQRAVERSA